MLRKEWQHYASIARKIAKHIKTGAEENSDGTRWSKIIDVQDINATAALNKKFAKDGSRASVHTYWGGKQEIATTHTDGSKCIFQTNGECQPTNNPMDIEVAQYMNNSKNESKNMNKKLIKLTESDLHRIIKESVKKIIKENDDFQPHGYKGTSNWGGNEIQIDDRGEAARLRDSHTGQVTDWMEIQFDEEGVAYVIDENGNEERLCDYMKY